MNKNTLRTTLAKKYTESDLHAYVSSSLTQLATNMAFKAAARVLVYEPRRDEIPFVSGLIAQHSDKTYYFPHPQKPEFASLDLQTTWKADWVTHTIAIVPARAVDSSGNRLGRGGGWYDRFLAQNPSLHTIAVIPDFACIREIPVEKHDIPVTEIIIATP